MQKMGHPIDIVTDYVYSTENSKVPPYHKEAFRKLLRIATSGIFEYNGSFYKQVDGIMMGSPLSVTLANIFMGYIECKIMSDSDVKKPHFYARYIDDIFAVFSNVTDHILFMDILNKQHPNLKFTCEFGGKHIAFLDVNVSIENANFDTWVFRKETNTNVILNRIAVCPIQWKTSLLTCLLNRAWLVCSSYKRLQEEFVKLRSIFVQNGYSNVFFDRTLKRFLNKKFDCNEDKLSVSDTQERFYVMKVPFIGKPSIVFKQRFLRLVRKISTCRVNVAIVFQTCKVKDFFSLKSKSSSYLTANCVYKFTCQRDSDMFYIGQTSRHLGIRAKEHLNIQTENPSAIGSHIMNCEGCLSSLRQGQLTEDNFKVIKTCRTKFDTELLEALLINKLTPRINRLMYNTGSALTLNVFR